MRKISKRFIITISFFLFMSVSYQAESKDVSDTGNNALVKWAYDGDTIVLSDNTKVRLTGINALEIPYKNKKSKGYGITAKKFLLKLVRNKYVNIVYDQVKKDQYGRTLAYVYLQDQTFVNAAMIKEGLAYCLYQAPNTRFAENFLAIQKEAMLSKKGMWSKGKQDNEKVVGNSNTYRFHKSSCCFGKRTLKKHTIIFESTWDAFYEGYAPCKKCF